jgi:hypothetical protein
MVRWPYHSTVFAKPIALSVLITLATFCAIPYRAAAGHKAKGDVERDLTFANICAEIIPPTVGDAEKLTPSEST